MPPSPALRCSPARVENHKRGHSLESGLHLKDKDDDLTLFNEMHNRERDNFLHPSADDFDDSLSMKLRYFLDFKLGISIPVRGESSDLLNGDGEKNDYDWLLTPPDTPLFRSLDDEAPPVNLVRRGRPRSQPISISRSTTMEKSYRNSRSSASPHRLSPSPRSSNSTLQSRGRPSSAPNNSVSPVLRPSSPSRRPSTPPNKPATPAPRSSTPTLRRNSTGSGGYQSTPGRRGPSPVKASRGNSASPKLRAWQSNLPGFSSDPPPNLRTSLSDRPSSRVRGLSPASTNGRDTPTKSGRQSMSPTVSRSASSSNSHDRDKFSSQSKGSAVSSFDEDMESVQSIPSSKQALSDHATPRKNGAFSNSRPTAFPKKTSRTIVASSAPKRSFDSALRQMDHRKSPQNMFRPLLSSVPTTTFYVGKANTSHRPMVSMNSSVTTSSNASSEHAASIAPDTEGSDHEQDDLVNEWEKVPYPSAHEDVFIFDKVDEINEDIENSCRQDAIGSEGPAVVLNSTSEDTHIDAHENNDGCSTAAAELRESEKLGNRDAAETISGTTELESLDVGGAEIVASCSKCGKSFHVFGNIMGEPIDICQNCAEKDQFLLVATESGGISDITVDRNKLVSQLGFELRPNELLERTNGTSQILGEQEKRVEWVPKCLSDNHPVHSILDKDEQLPVDLIVGNQQRVGSSQSDGDTSNQQFEHTDTYPSLRIDDSEGTGISVLLMKRSTSSKWPVVQGRAFTATNIPCSNPSYVGDSLNARSALASTAVDASSSRQTEARIQRQLSSKRSEMENARNDSNTRSQTTACPSPLNSHGAYKSPVHSKSKSQENFVSDEFVVDIKSAALEDGYLFIEENNRVKEKVLADIMDSSSVIEQDKGVMDNSAPEHSSREEDFFSEDSPKSGTQDEVHSFIEEGISSGNIGEFIQNSTGSFTEKEVPLLTSESSKIAEGSTLDYGVDVIDVAVADMAHTSDMMLGEQENDQDNHSDSQSDFATSANGKNIVEALEELSAFTTSEAEPLFAAPESVILDHSGCILEESTIKVEGPKGNLSRSLTLEEATDTILFCSSIVHSLAYKAATIAMEKENLAPLEGSRPTVTILGKSSPEGRGLRSGISKRTAKSHKSKARRLETDFKTTSTKIVTEVESEESLAHDSNGPNKPDSMKPPKLESKCNCSVM